MLKITLTCHVIIYHSIERLIIRFHILLLLSYFVLYKMDQQLDHPLTYFHKTDLGPDLN